jgi:TolB protein
MRTAATRVWRRAGPSTSVFHRPGANQVQVVVAKGETTVASKVFSGTSLRNALFRAADFAVESTSDLKGFFASKLAFIVDKGGKMEVHTGDLFFGEVRQITRDNSQALKPRLSPDGTKLLYTSYFRTHSPDIYLIDLNSLQRTTFVSLREPTAAPGSVPTVSRWRWC